MPRCFPVLPVILFLLLVTTPSFADQWDPQFGSASPFPLNAGFNNQVRDVLVDGDDIYVCGDFTAMGSTPVSRVVHWNGSTWSDLGITLTHTFGQPWVGCLAKYQQWVVAAGRFVTVNGQPGNIALWDGASWSTVTIAPNPFESNASITALLSADGYLYVGGNTAFLPTPGCVWRWDGISAAQPLSSTGYGGFNDYVGSLLSRNGNLYAGGYFDRIDGVTMKNVGRWDGSNWHAMGTGISTIVNSLVVFDDAVYAVGEGIAKFWNGATWVMPSSELLDCYSTSSGEGLSFQDRLYMTGPTGVYNGLAVSDGSGWMSMTSGLSPTVCFPQIAEYQGKVLVAGQFSAAGGIPAPGMALWNNTSWYTRAPDNAVTAMAVTDTDVYVLGRFENIFETPFHHGARWDGASWHPLGSGIDGTVNAALVVGDDVYVGGQFTDAGGSGAVNLAKWNGATWSAVGPALNGPVYALASDGTDVYVGGDFQDQDVKRIARWDGSAFHALGGGVLDGSVRAILVDGNRVYAGGDFSLAGNNYASGNAAYFDGDWHTLANGFNDGRVRDLELHGGVLFAAGDFTSGGLLNRIAAWNGSAWVGLPALGSPALNLDAYAMASSGDALFVTGDFTTAGGVAANHIAKWQTLGWSSLGAGLNARANALAMTPGGLYAGGEFRFAGGQSSQHFARWMPTISAVTPRIATKTALEPVFPNPFNPSTTIRFRVSAATRVTIAIYDAKGRRVRALLDENVPGSAGERTITWNGINDAGTTVASGVYFVRMHTPTFSESRKMVLLK